MAREKYISRQEFADLIGVDVRMVAEYRKRAGAEFPCRVKGRTITVPVTRAVRWYIEFKVTDELRRRRPEDGTSGRMAAKERRELAEAALAEHRLDRELGKTIDIDTVAREILRYQERVRATLLAARSRYADRIAPAVLKTVMNSILRDLQRESDESADDADAMTGAAA